MQRHFAKCGKNHEYQMKVSHTIEYDTDYGHTNPFLLFIVELLMLQIFHVLNKNFWV